MPVRKVCLDKKSQKVEGSNPGAGKGSFHMKSPFKCT